MQNANVKCDVKCEQGFTCQQRLKIIPTLPITKMHWEEGSPYFVGWPMEVNRDDTQSLQNV